MTRWTRSKLIAPNLTGADWADAKINTINAVGDNDMVFQRNSVEYYRLDGANSIVNVETSEAISSVL